MFSLVFMPDIGQYNICMAKNVIQEDDGFCLVAFKAKLICNNESLSSLCKIQDNINHNIPRVVVSEILLEHQPIQEATGLLEEYYRIVKLENDENETEDSGVIMHPPEFSDLNCYPADTHAQDPNVPQTGCNTVEKVVKLENDENETEDSEVVMHPPEFSDLNCYPADTHAQEPNVPQIGCNTVEKEPINKELPWVDPGLSKLSPSKKNKKRYFCCFCKKLITSFAVHLTNVHRAKPEVMAIARLPKRSRERKELIGRLSKRGTFEFNQETGSKTGELIISRRPQKDVTKKISHYKICPNCKGYFSGNCITRHFARCAPKAQKRSINAYQRFVNRTIHPEACLELVNTILPSLREDKITNIVCRDELIIKFGNEICRTVHAVTVRNNLRVLAHIVTIVQKYNPNVKDLASVFSLKYIPYLKQTANKSIHRFGFTALYKCGILRLETLREQNDVEKINVVIAFLKTIKKEIKTIPNKILLGSENRKSIIPSPLINKKGINTDEITDNDVSVCNNDWSNLSIKAEPIDCFNEPLEDSTPNYATTTNIHESISAEDQRTIKQKYLVTNINRYKKTLEAKRPKKTDPKNILNFNAINSIREKLANEMHHHSVYSGVNCNKINQNKF